MSVRLCFTFSTFTNDYNQFMYLFIGYPSSGNTWELAASLSCPDVLKRYQSRQKNELDSSVSAKAAKSKTASKSKATGKKTKTPLKKLKTNAKSKSSPLKPATKAARKQTVETEDEEEPDWEVEKIIDVRYNDDGTKNFLIRWKGCDPSQDTWEPEDNVHSPDLVNEFMSKADGGDDNSAPRKKSRKA